MDIRTYVRVYKESIVGVGRVVVCLQCVRSPTSRYKCNASHQKYTHTHRHTHAHHLRRPSETNGLTGFARVLECTGPSYRVPVACFVRQRAFRGSNLDD